MIRWKRATEAARNAANAGVTVAAIEVLTDDEFEEIPQRPRKSARLAEEKGEADDRNQKGEAKGKGKPRV